MSLFARKRRQTQSSNSSSIIQRLSRGVSLSLHRAKSAFLSLWSLLLLVRKEAWCYGPAPRVANLGRVAGHDVYRLGVSYIGLISMIESCVLYEA